ncbi:MAG: hypothetical protein ACF8PN_12835 [Phycisphaerales bacterium]
MRRSPALMLIGILAFLMAIAAVAQPVEPEATPGGELSPESVELPSVGLSMRFPSGTSITKNPQSTRRLVAVSEDQTWIAEISVVRTTVDDITISDLADGAIKTATEESETTTVRKHATLEINGQPAEQITLQLRRKSGVQETRIHTIFKPAPKTFVVHTFFCGADHAEKALPLNEKSVQTIAFTSADEMAEQRIEALQATDQALASLDEAKYRAMLAADRWFRIYRPLEGGGEDAIGYYNIREEIAPRGAVGKGRSPSSYSPSEREDGVLVSLVGRYKFNENIVDVEIRAWMSFDRQQEAWTISSSAYERAPDELRTGDPRRDYLYAGSSTLTGATNGGRITIIVDDPPQPKQEVVFQKSADAYITQAEVYMLYRMLKPFQHQKYGMFAFEPSRQKLEYRTEVFERSGTDDRWTATQKRSLDSPPNTVTIDADGTIVRIVNSNGEVTVPSDADEIRRLGESSGLPTVSLRRKR